MIQIATGLHKLDRGRPDVACTLLIKAMAKLENCADSMDGLDLTHLKRDVVEVLAALEAGRLPTMIPRLLSKA